MVPWFHLFGQKELNGGCGIRIIMSQGDDVFEFLRDAAPVAEGEGSQDAGPSFKSDLLEHYNLRDLYDNLVATKWQPPRKVGKAEYFVYNTIAGDGHLRSDVGEAGTSKYDLAPVAEVRKATEEVKLRPLGSNMIKEAFPLEPGHFELPKVRERDGYDVRRGDDGGT